MACHVYRINGLSVVEFRECFYLFARSGQIKTLDELTIIMRSLGLSPTIAELNKYLKDKGKASTDEKYNYKVLFLLFDKLETVYTDFRWKDGVRRFS